MNLKFLLEELAQDKEGNEAFNINGKSTSLYINPSANEFKLLKQGDRGFIAIDKKTNKLSLFVAKNSGFLFHVKIWEKLSQIGFTSGSYFTEIENGNLVSLQLGNDHNFYMSENYEIEKIRPNMKMVKEIQSKFPYISFIGKTIPNEKLD